MDHPGMAFAKRLSGPDFLFERLGGVPEDLSRDGKVDIFRLDRPSHQKPIRGRIIACVSPAAGGSEFRIRVGRDDSDEVGPGSFAMLALRPLEARKRRLRARACDDLAGVTAGLCFLDELLSRHSPIRAGLLLTRAEETGLGGMLAAARSGSLDRRALYVNIECSSCRAGAQLGAGPVVRVGDRISLFDPQITGGLVAVAEELTKAAAGADRPFRYQRKLMDGGTCEATTMRAGMAFGRRSSISTTPSGWWSSWWGWRCIRQVSRERSRRPARRWTGRSVPGNASRPDVCGVSAPEGPLTRDGGSGIVLDDGPAAVDDECVTGDHTGRFGQQEDNWTRYLLRLGQIPSQQILLLHGIGERLALAQGSLGQG